MVVKRTLYQRKVDVDILNAVKSVLADVLSVSPLSEQRRENFNYCVVVEDIQNVQNNSFNLSLSNEVCHPRGVGFGYFLASESTSLDDEVIDRQLVTSICCFV